MSQQPEGKGPSTSFVIGAVALAFLITGYQTALFVHSAATLDIVARADRPDTVYVIERVPADADEGDPDSGRPLSATSLSRRIVRRNGPHKPAVRQVRERYAARQYQSFPFDPNTVSIEDLERLGFTLRQAEAIDRYRTSGGRFRRKEDFAKSYVVEDSVFQRLAP